VCASRDADVLHIPRICAIKLELAKTMFTSQIHIISLMEEQSLESYKSFELKDTKITVTSSFDEKDVPTWNVVGMVEGTGPALSKEFITVIAHLDHLLQRKGLVCNGADDNASGSAGVMEIAEAVAMNPPKRSVVFVLFTKEKGLAIGLRHFVGRCPLLLDKIILNLNLGIIGRTDPFS
jgi:Zn-dependent M28 family amino/carboxypeptidase